MSGSDTVDNKRLAQAARDLADQHPGGSLERRAAACAAVAFGTTSTAKAARTALTDHLDGDVLAAALAVLVEMTAPTP